MALNPQQLKNLGTVLGITVFAGPLVLLYISLSSWDADEAIKAKHEMDRRRRREAALEERRAAEAHRAAAKRASSGKRAEAETGAAKEGPVALTLKRVSNYKIEVAFTNVSEKDLWLAVPDGPGGLVRVAPAGKEPAAAIEPLYDADRDDYVKKLLAGAEHHIKLKRQAGFPRGRIRAVYDSRGPGVPGKAWRGKVESPPVE